MRADVCHYCHSCLTYATRKGTGKELPFFLLYGRDPRIPSESALNSPSSPYMADSEDYKSELINSLSGAWEIAQANIYKKPKYIYTRSISMTNTAKNPN